MRGCPVGRAGEALKHAIEIARNQAARSFELRASTRLARLWRDQGTPAQARDLLALVHGSLPKTRNPRPTRGPGFAQRARLRERRLFQLGHAAVFALGLLLGEQRKTYAPTEFFPLLTPKRTWMLCPARLGRLGFWRCSRHLGSRDRLPAGSRGVFWRNRLILSAGWPRFLRLTLRDTAALWEPTRSTPCGP